MIEARSHDYTDGKTEFEGWLAWDAQMSGPRPGVLIAHAFGGLGDFEKQQADRLARMGYVAFAIDYYGKGKRANSREEASEMMGKLNSDRPTLAARMATSLQEIRTLPQVDAERVAAIGFCFGGKAVLDLARTGADVAASVVIHGVYDAPSAKRSKMDTSILVLHGWNDPLAKPESVIALTDELNETCADWQLLAFGHTGHAFTNPAANMPDEGMAYDAKAEARSWSAIQRFLSEKFEQVG